MVLATTIQKKLHNSVILFRSKHREKSQVTRSHSAMMAQFEHEAPTPTANSAVAAPGAEIKPHKKSNLSQGL